LRPQDAGALFQMACDCKFLDSWNQELARNWWEKHLPELSGPLTADPLAEQPGKAVITVH
jgi:hypothetical protein